MRTLALAPALAGLALTLAAAPAAAQIEEGGKPPSFEEALAAARRDGKPLVVELFAVW